MSSECSSVRARSTSAADRPSVRALIARRAPRGSWAWTASRRSATATGSRAGGPASNWAVKRSGTMRQVLASPYRGGKETQLTDALTRRDVLKAGAAGAEGAGMLGALCESALRAMAAPPRCGRLKDIDHVVILMQENRSFDHYFGRYRGVRGFADPKALKLHDGSGNTVFAQPGYNHAGFNGHLHPFRLSKSKGEGCAGGLDNPNHDWGTQHRMWHNRRMDHFLIEQEKIEGDRGAPVTMGYHQRADIPCY